MRGFVGTNSESVNCLQAYCYNNETPSFHPVSAEIEALTFLYKPCLENGLFNPHNIFIETSIALKYSTDFHRTGKN